MEASTSNDNELKQLQDEIIRLKEEIDELKSKTKPKSEPLNVAKASSTTSIIVLEFVEKDEPMKKILCDDPKVIEQDWDQIRQSLNDFLNKKYGSNVRTSMSATVYSIFHDIRRR